MLETKWYEYKYLVLVPCVFPGTVIDNEHKYGIDVHADGGGNDFIPSLTNVRKAYTGISLSVRPIIHPSKLPSLHNFFSTSSWLSLICLKFTKDDLHHM